MKTDTITLKEIIPAEYNPRAITNDEQKKLSNNLKKFGLVDPIIINLKNKHIIGGHQRYEVLKKEDKDKEYSLIRLGDIGWVFENAPLSIEDEDHEKALNLSLNKISGDWDYDKLTNVLSSLQNTEFDMDLTGFDEIELSSFNIEENIFLDESIFRLEEEYTPPKKEEPVEETSENMPSEFSEGEDGEDSDDEILFNESETTHYCCPKCGYEW